MINWGINWEHQTIGTLKHKPLSFIYMRENHRLATTMRHLYLLDFLWLSWLLKCNGILFILYIQVSYISKFLIRVNWQICLFHLNQVYCVKILFMLKQFIHESQMKCIRFRKFITHYSHEAPETYKNHKVPTQVHVNINNCSRK